MMACLLQSLGLLVLIAAAQAGDESTRISAEKLRALGAKLQNTVRQLEMLEKLSSDEDMGRSGLKDKIKEMCNCQSHKVCECCYKHGVNLQILIPPWLLLIYPSIKQYFSPKVCATFEMDPPNKLLNIKASFGIISLYKTSVSLVPYTRICKTLENNKFENFEFNDVEFCTDVEVKESVEKGLSACVKVHLKLMGVMNKPILFPCLNFKNNKLTLDDEIEGYKEGDLQMNLKKIWEKIMNKFKG